MMEVLPEQWFNILAKFNCGDVGYVRARHYTTRDRTDRLYYNWHIPFCVARRKANTVQYYLAVSQFPQGPLDSVFSFSR